MLYGIGNKQRKKRMSFIKLFDFFMLCGIIITIENTEEMPRSYKSGLGADKKTKGNV